MILYPNAKINLGLNVIERRADGYHNIETIFYPVELCDEIKLVPSTLIDGEYRLQVDGRQIDGNLDDNLIIKALMRLKRDFPVPRVEITLNKQIPFGAGLGGGSSDAAFILKGLNELFQLGLSAGQLELMATDLGADCPFFIYNEPVFATGIGNVFKSVELSLRGHYLLLVKPDIYVSTPQTYAAITPKCSKYSLFESIQQPIEKWRYEITNDFEEPVFRKYPEIADIKTFMYDSGAMYASMSGSGSSVYGIFNEKPNADVLKKRYDDVFVLKLNL